MDFVDPEFPMPYMRNKHTTGSSLETCGHPGKCDFSEFLLLPLLSNQTAETLIPGGALISA